MAADKEHKAKSVENIDRLLESLQDKFGEGSIMKLGSEKKVSVPVVRTGSFSLDFALGIGGFPIGKIVEIFGPEMSGKSTLSLQVIAHAQQKEGKAAYIDAEHAFDPEYAKRIGVNVKDLLISQPDNGEEALNILEALIRSEMIEVVVIDSVAALTPKAEIEGEMGAQYIGLQARLMSQALRKITALAHKGGTLILFTNQIREKIGMMGYGDPTTTPGGRALKFYSSIRVELKRIAQIKKGEEVIGNRVRAKVVKNKLAPPFRTTEFDVIYGEGVSYEGDVLNQAIKAGVVSKNGNTYFFDDAKLGVGVDAARITLKSDKKLLNSLEKKLRAALGEAEKA